MSLTNQIGKPAPAILNVFGVAAIPVVLISTGNGHNAFKGWAISSALHWDIDKKAEY
jgi:hypothetical protein